MKRLSAIGGAVLWIVAGAAMVLGCLGLTMGYDVWFHLLNGEYIVSAGEIPHHDRWLIPMAGTEPRFFPNYEWLFGVAARLAWNAGGYGAIDILRGILILSAFAFAAAASRRRLPESAYARCLVPAVLLLGFAAASARFEPRPQLVSAAGLALLTLLVRAPGPVGVACLVPAALVWANCHIEILLGIGYAVIWLVAYRAAEGSRSGARAWLALYPAILVAAVALSPAGAHLVGQAGSYYEGERMIRAMGFWNVELAGMSFEPFRFPGPLFILVSLVALAARGVRTRRLFDPESLSAAAFIILPFISNRYIFSSAVILIPFVAGEVGELLPRTGGTEESPKPLAAGALGIAAVLWFAPAAFVPGNPSRPDPAGCAATPAAYEAFAEFPDAALRFLNRNRPGGRLFTHDKWGNFAAFYDNPCRHLASATARMPWMNAMFQTMPWRRIELYLNAIVDETAWRRLAAEAGFDTLILPYPDGPTDPWHPFMRRIAFDPAWNLVWWDDTAFAYVASAGLPAPSAMKAYEVARPDRWYVTGRFPETPDGRRDALAELARARGTPEGARVVRTLQWMAGLMMQTGDATSTIVLLASETTALSRRHAILDSLLGEAYGRAGRWEEAYERLSVAAQGTASSAMLFYNLAVAAARSDRFPEARTALEKCLRCDPAFDGAVRLREIIGE